MSSGKQYGLAESVTARTRHLGVNVRETSVSQAWVGVSVAPVPLVSAHFARIGTRPLLGGTIVQSLGNSSPPLSNRFALLDGLENSHQYPEVVASAATEYPCAARPLSSEQPVPPVLQLPFSATNSYTFPCTRVSSLSPLQGINVESQSQCIMPLAHQLDILESCPAIVIPPFRDFCYSKFWVLCANGSLCR